MDDPWERILEFRIAWSNIFRKAPRGICVKWRAFDCLPMYHVVPNFEPWNLFLDNFCYVLPRKQQKKPIWFRNGKAFRADPQFTPLARKLALSSPMRVGERKETHFIFDWAPVFLHLDRPSLGGNLAINCGLTWKESELKKGARLKARDELIKKERIKPQIGPLARMACWYRQSQTTLLCCVLQSLIWNNLEWFLKVFPPWNLISKGSC